MLRVISFVALSVLAFSEGCAPPPCHWDNPQRIEDYFNQVANKMVAADRKLQMHCGQQGGASVKEVHGPSNYKLVYVSAGGAEFEVKVRDRVLLVKAQNCDSPVLDVRILPPYVNAPTGTYTVDGADLVITFQYKYDPTQGGGSCVPPDTNIIPLSKEHNNDEGGCDDDCNFFINGLV